MKKEEAIECLSKYREKNGDLQQKKIQLKRLMNEKYHLENDEYQVNITPSYTEGSKSNSISSKVENAVIKKSDRLEEIEKQIKELRKEISNLELDVAEVEALLSKLTPLEQNIVSAYYIDKYDYGYIGEKIYYDMKSQTRSAECIKSIIKKSMEKMVN